MKGISRILFVLIFTAPAFVSAESYYWTVPFPDANVRYTSGTAACNANHAYYVSANPGYEQYQQNITRGETSFGCETLGLRRNGQGVLLPSGKWSNGATRRGASCEPGETYDPNIGGCESPPGNPGESCEEDQPALTGFGRIQNSEGQCVDFTRADTPSQCKNLGGRTGFTDIYVTFDSDGNPQTPPPTTVQGCETTVVDVAHCKMAPVRNFATGGQIQSSVNKCRVGVAFSGKTSDDGDFAVAKSPNDEGACDPATECANPDPAPIEKEERPCTYTTDGEGRRVCHSSNFDYKPGESNCGSVNGTFQCIGKAPSATGVDIRTSVTETNNPDGSKTIVKEDVATHTNCVGAYSCTTQTTNNKTVTHKDGNGNTVSENTTCTGANCGKGMGDKANCKPGEDCSKEEGEEFGGPENEEVPGFGEALEGFKAKVEAAPLIAGVKGISMPSGGSCSMSSASTPIGTISGQGVCDNSSWLDPLYAVFLAMGALNAVRILMSA